MTDKMYSLLEVVNKGIFKDEDVIQAMKEYPVFEGTASMHDEIVLAKRCDFIKIVGSGVSINSRIYELTDAGKSAFNKEKTKRDKAEKKENYDFLQKKFIYRSRYMPYVFSLIAVGISIAAYFKPVDKQIERIIETRTIQVDSSNEILIRQKPVLKTSPK